MALNDKFHSKRPSENQASSAGTVREQPRALLGRFEENWSLKAPLFITLFKKEEVDRRVYMNTGPLKNIKWSKSKLSLKCWKCS